MIEVAAAIIGNAEGELLIARRREGKTQAGYWEFPGGKIEPGESVPDCLRRELLEEMAIEIEPLSLFGASEHRYGDRDIRLTAWRAAYRSGEIALTDHDAYAWVHPGRLAEYRLAPADIPFADRLREEAEDGT